MATPRCSNRRHRGESICAPTAAVAGNADAPILTGRADRSDDISVLAFCAA